MKKIFKCLTVFMALLLLCGCASGGSRLVEENGNYYLVLQNRDEADDSSSGCELAPLVRFDSVAEMKRDIQTGSFTDHEWKQIARFQTDSDGRIQICNLAQLYEPVFPSTFSHYAVKWYGTGYYFTLSSEQTNKVTPIGFMSKDSYDKKIAELYEIENNPRIQIERKSTEPDRSATAYYYSAYGNPINQIKVLVYQITTDDSVFHVKETYSLNESKTVPQYITVYGTCKNQYFDIIIQYLTERPSVAWLSSFGLREYVEAEAG